MTRSKLSDSDKHNMIQLFRESEETIAQLANRFEVSSSTIRRILKSHLPNQEYEALIATKQEKRLPKTARKQKPIPVIKTDETCDDETQTTQTTTRDDEHPKPIKVIESPIRPAPIKKRSRSDSLSASEVEAHADSSEAYPSKPADDEDLAEIIADIEHDLHDRDLDGESDEDDLDDFDADDDDDADADPAIALNLASVESIQILPFAEANFPKTCYLVIDRSAELITCPLKAFGDLGSIPDTEVDATTLPIFDNHRIARRFSHRTQRIVKIPNSSVLQKACPQLLAKGITRLLINGLVYSL